MSKISAAFGRLQNQRGGSRARRFREEDQAFRNANQTPESIQTEEIADSIGSLPVNELNESMVGITADESNRVEVVDDQGSPTSTRPGANVPQGPANLNELDVNVIGANQNAIDQIKDMGGIPTDEDMFPPQEGREIKDPATYSNLPLPDTITDEQRARGDRSIKDSIEEKIQTELDEIKKPSQMKKLGFYGSEIGGLRQGNKIYSAKPVEFKGKVGFRVTDEFGSFETIDLKTFAKRFG